MGKRRRRPTFTRDLEAGSVSRSGYAGPGSDSDGELLDHRRGSHPQSSMMGSPFSDSNEIAGSVSSRRGARSKFMPHNFVERWLRKNSTGNASQRMPLLHQSSGGGDDMYTIPLEEALEFSDSASLRSKPSTRRLSNNDVVDDVCMPMASPREVDSERVPSKKLWPDLSVLNEYAAKELKEIAETEAAELVNQGLSDCYAVNEAEQDGPLRPTRIVPWMKSSKMPDGTEMFDQYRGGRSPGPDYHYTYFRDDLSATVHSPSISGLLQPGQTFEDLFPVIDTTTGRTESQVFHAPTPLNQSPKTGSPLSGPTQPLAQTQAPQLQARQLKGDDGQSSQDTAAEARSQPFHQPQPSASSQQTHFRNSAALSSHSSIHGLPAQGSTVQSHTSRNTSPTPSAKDAGPFWLDILNPSEEEMRAISKAFGIHPLTTEDILLRETREKVEIFHNYYFVCFTSFDVNNVNRRRQRTANSGANSTTSQTSSHRRHRSEKLKALPLYTVVFHTGVITVHYAPTPHTVNVRRRIRLLSDYLNLSSDWISYALIDDITDGFAPMIASIEEDVTLIEDAILNMHSGAKSESESESDDDDYLEGKRSASSTTSTGYREWRQKNDMLRWIGESRKRVMNLLRLLGNKADVLKGFSKRVTEQWSGAPRAEIAMYLGDIQDHLITMVQSLNHYEKLLARSHSNYLAQINIDMTKANNDMNDVLSKISVLGTIVLPMNVVTGLWGMNVLVPGQHIENTLWFYSILGMMIIFGLVSYFVVKRYL